MFGSVIVYTRATQEKAPSQLVNRRILLRIVEREELVPPRSPIARPKTAEHSSGREHQKQQSTEKVGSIKQVWSTRGRTREKLRLYQTVAFVFVGVGQ